MGIRVALLLHSSLGLWITTFTGSAVAQDAPPTLAQAGDFIQRQLDGFKSIVVVSKPDIFAQITNYVSAKVAGCSMSVTMDEAFGDIDSEPVLRESYVLSFATIDPSSVAVTEFFDAGLLDFNVTKPLSITSTDVKKTEVTKINTAQFRFQDVQTAKRVQKALARVAELCGAKKDVF